MDIHTNISTRVCVSVCLKIKKQTARVLNLKMGGGADR